MDETTKAKLAINLGAAYKMWSNWLMTAAGTLGTVWLALPADQQKALLEHSPLPAWAYPIVLSVIGIGLRVWPQKSITPAEAEAKSAS